jgi:hypothetical protein
VQKYSKQKLDGKSSPLKSGAGFTILEIPIAIFIISVVLILYAASTNSILLNRNARYQDVATRIGTSLMEDLRNTPYANLPISGSMSHAKLDDLPNGQAAITVTDIDDNMKEMTITVSWQEGGSSVVRSASFTTLISRNGI